MLPRLALPPSPLVLVLLALAFALPGLPGHDPWKSFDAIAIEIAHQMHVTGDWAVPRVAGQPWLDDPPLYHWLALAFGKLLGGLVPFHNGARLASGACVLAALWLLYRRGGAAAPLLLIGAIGFMVHSHEALPELAGLASACAAFALLPYDRARPMLAGAGFGAALGLCFLATGWWVPAALALAALAAHAVCPRWRNWRALPFLGAAALAGLAVGAAWPWVLSARAPEVLAQWWAQAARTSGEPTLIEVITYRFRGHSMSDPGLYRTKDEVEEWKRRDPLNRSRARLTELGMSEDELQALEADVKAEIEDAVKFAEESPAADEYFPYVVKE